ncbi:MAG TPA: hypothetical protein VM914_08835 [Pyrinomonadaceae bacterium]|nr:hypothetical protein [Pyrinomonadaceae bacterium]
MRTFALLLALLLLYPASSAAALDKSPTPFDVLEEFDRLSARPLWPGFDPRRVPVEIYDGRATYLFRHPSPPPEFKETPGRPGVRVFAGRHESVRANSNVELGGVGVATAVITPDKNLPLRRSAALLVHEAFHVFQRARHPEWTGNEVELFVYPFEDAEQLRLRRSETEALRRAVAARADGGAACWARAAVEARRARFKLLPAGAAGYERGTELNEGLARYVEARAAGGKGDELPADDYAPEEVRARSYATGRALGLLLDRLDPGWKRRLESGDPRPLDELLEASLASAKRARVCALPRAFQEAARTRATRDVETLRAKKAEWRREFFARPGWKVVVVAGEGEPLWPQNFDPLNVRSLGGGEVLHTRWLKVGNSAGAIEVLERPSLTEGRGSHPLFNGVSVITAAGLAAEPEVREDGGALVIKSEGFKAELKGARWERSGQTVTVRLSRAR